jgi:hypothetical protein
MPQSDGGLYMHLFAAGEGAPDVPFQQRGDGLFGLPLRVLWSQRLDAVQREQELEIHRLLGSQRAVIVKGGDPKRVSSDFVCGSPCLRFHGVAPSLSNVGGGRGAATTVSGLVALRFRRCDGLLDLGLQITDIEAGTGLHRRILDEAWNILGNDLARNLESPHLVFEGIIVAN